MTFYDIKYLYKDDCLQCQYITALLDKNESITDEIKRINAYSDEGQLLKEQYNINRVPYIIVFDSNGNYVGGTIINSKDDLNIIINNYIF